MIIPQFIMGYVVPLSGPSEPPRPRPPITVVKGELDDNGNEMPESVERQRKVRGLSCS